MTSHVVPTREAPPGTGNPRHARHARHARRARRARRHIALMLTATFVSWVGQRLGAIALPLVALAQTGEAWTTGLVAGAAGLPVIAAPWWTARLRHRVDSGRMLGLLTALAAAGTAVVPVAALTVGLGAGTLVASGLVLGCCTALTAPGQRALLADIGDALSPATSVRALTGQDFAHRISMTFAPALGALVVALGHPITLLWVESAALATAAGLLAAVPSYPAVRMPGGLSPAPSLREALRQWPTIARAIAVNAIGGACWFAFSLGLAIRGAEIGRPGVLIAAGMTGYGIASVLGAALAPLAVPRLPVLPTIGAGWALLGVSFVALSVVLDSPGAVLACGALGGAAMPLLIGAHNALIAGGTTGQLRRECFAADATAYAAAGAVGMTLGGAVIGVAGAPATLLAAGTVQLLAPGLLVLRRRPRTRPTP